MGTPAPAGAPDVAPSVASPTRATARASRVLWISHGHELGGAELALAEGVRALARKGIASAVVVPREGPLAERLRAAGAAVHVAGYRWWASATQRWHRRAARTAANLLSVAGLVRLMRRLRPDVVITNTLVVPQGALAARLLGLPHVWFINEFGWEDHALRYDLGERISLALVARLSHAIALSSDALYHHFAPRFGPHALHRVRYSVEVPASSVAARAGGAAFELVQVAQKIPGKRQDEAIRAVAILAGRGRDVRLSLIGRDEDPAYGPRLRTLVAELGVEQRVRLEAFDPDVTARLAAADAVLVCSRMEAFGRVAVEAMKLGTPVVGARSGGTAELIRDGWNGLAYEPGDPSQLADAVERLMGDSALRDELARNGRAWARTEFTPERYGVGLAAAVEAARIRAASA